MRKGRNKAQASLDQAIDDLLGGDDDDIIAPKSKYGGKGTSFSAKNHGSKNSPRRTLMSDASSKDFYNSLSAIAGHEISEGNLEEDVKVDPDDAANVAKSLADMDDLESDLFGSFTNKRNNQKSKGIGSLPVSKQKKKKPEFSDFDEDDPLAGLGLSDDDDILSKKPKSKKPDLSRKLSQSSSKGKVDPNIAGSVVKDPESSPIRSSSFDRDDPFLATDPRPRAGSGSERKFKRMNSWDDPSIGTQSESEVTPRSRSNSGGQQMKHSRKGSNKKKVNPCPSKTENDAMQKQDDVIDQPDSTKIGYNHSSLEESKKNKDNSNVAKQVDDIFADEDDLPGLSDDDGGSPVKRPVRNVTDGSEGVRKATAALDDLLGAKSKANESKERRPTRLEQIMAKGSSSRKNSAQNHENPVTASPDKEMQFGGYSPSVGGAKERPTTAPNKRSVRFADELGFDELDFSLNDSRPSTAPGSGRSMQTNSRLKDATIGSSFEDENTDVSLDLSAVDFQRPKLNVSSGMVDSKKKERVQKDSKEHAEKKQSSVKATSPRRNLQNSRRSSERIGNSKEQEDLGDWLGVDGSSAAPHSGSSATKTNEGQTSGETMHDKKSIQTQERRRKEEDDWLGLGDEFVNDANEQQNYSIETSDDLRKNATTTPAPPDDELFPWEMRGSRDKRRKSSKLNNDETNPRSDGFQDAMPGKGSYVEDSVVVKGDPVTSSTPKESKRNAEDQPKSESRRNPRRLQASSSFIIEDPKSSQVPFLQNPQMPNDAQKNGVLSAPMMNEFSARSYRDSAPAAVQPQSQPEINVQKLHLQENPTMNQQVPPVAASAGQSPVSSAIQLGYDQNALLAHMLAAQRPVPLFPVGYSETSMASGVPSTSLDASILTMQLEKANAEKAVQQIKEYEVSKSHNEKEIRSLDSELRTLQAKVKEMEEKDLRAKLDSVKRIEDLEEQKRKQEAENDHLNSSKELLKKRHAEEMKTTENSHRMRFQILEDTYDRREIQLKEEHEYAVKQLNERIKALEAERNGILIANKERLLVVEKNKEADIERMKMLHNKTMEELSNDYDDQLERLRLLKEQEVAAATNTFSQTKSLQSLMQQVQSSTKEVEQIQKRIDLSHKGNLSDREASLRAKDEFLKSMQERLQRQETESAEERSRLQTLVARLELQLREQGRQLEQDKWKILQDENRLKSMQAAVEEERKYTAQQLIYERQMIDKSRDDLMNEQRRILSECYEERRKIKVERTELETMQSKYNEESLAKGFSVLKERDINLSNEEKRQEKERQTLEVAFEKMSEEKLKLQDFAKRIQEKSKLVEKLSKDAITMQQDGIESLEHAQALRLEASHASALLENRALLLDQQERDLLERLSSFETAKMQFEVVRDSPRCEKCQNYVTETAPQPSRNASFMAAKFVKGLTEEEAHVFQQQQQQHQHHVEGTFPSPANSVQSSTATTVSLLTDGPPELDKVPRWQPPDVILGSLNFNRTIRKWSSDKEQDEEFFEEESRFLNEVQRKRETQFTSAS